MTKVDQAGVSDIGLVRGRNEDCLGCHIPDSAETLALKGQLFVVADGVGGYGAGDVASSEAVKTLIEVYYSSGRSPAAALKHAFSHVNLHIFDLAIKTNHHRMQTTLSAIAIIGTAYHIMHAGDSRIYRVRSNTQIEQLTTDHSEVAELVRMRILAPDKVRGHARRSIITKSVGAETIVRPYYRTGEVRADDYFVLCTDGVWEPIEDAEIGRIVIDNPPEKACRDLVRLAMDRNCRDNVSVQVVQVLEATTAPVSLSSPVAAWQRSLRRLFHRDDLL